MLTEKLQQRLRSDIGAEHFGGLGKLADWRRGLVDGIEADWCSGRHEPMRQRLTRPDSAMALALNSFLPWFGCLADLRVGGSTGFADLQFATRCPTGVRGTPPVVDLVASGPQGALGVVVRVFDYLAPRTSAVSADYRTLHVHEGMAGWIRVLHDGDAFRHLDAAGLAKIALGLSSIFRRPPITLLYLFLEPQAPGLAVFAAHRAELDRLGLTVAGGIVAFHACSLHELWQTWCAEDTPVGVRAIAAQLGRRYAVVMPRWAPL